MNLKNKKKLLSGIAVLAMSGAMVLGAASLTACSNAKEEASEGSKVAISTAAGKVYTSTEGKIYYVSPEGTITDAEVGNIQKPYDFFYLLGERSPLEPGDTVYVLPGTYTINSTITARASGTYNKYIRILNAAYFQDEAANEYKGDKSGANARVTLDFSNQEFDSTCRGVQLYSNYTYWYGIDVRGAGDNGFYIGGSFNTVEYGEFYDNRDSGLQLGRQESGHTTMQQWPSYNLIKNCTSHNNYDNETFGENADGFAAKLTIGFGNVFDGCIAYRNSDDGWDLYAKSDSGNIGAVIIYNCVAYENGYLEYSREECNSFYPTFAEANKDGAYNDATENKYTTRDGDGNGFKLGGSVMEGDVVMYNCLSFHNRMHGVTDNSNPGYLKIENVTSYDNSAAVNPETGKVEFITNVDTHGNIDVARQTYSYNTVKNVLSVANANVQSLDSDAYRGSVINSLLRASKEKANAVNGSWDADTKTGKDTSTSQPDALLDSDVFEMLPVAYNADAADNKYTYNVKGARDSGDKVTAVTNDKGETVKYTHEMLETRTHVYFRNADNSINMRQILNQKEGFNAKDYLSDLKDGERIGSKLNETSWDNYTHFVDETLFTKDAITSAQKAIVEKAKETLTINTEASAVFQDFEVPIVMQGADITWSSNDTDHLAVPEITDDSVETSISGSRYITLVVNRDVHEKKTVKLTATITYEDATAEKEFILTIMPGDPSIGTITVLTEDDEVIAAGGAIIIDQYSDFAEPEIRVQNGLYPDSQKYLASDNYKVKSTYLFAPNGSSNAVEIRKFTTSLAGVYTIVKNITLDIDGIAQSSKSMSYSIYVASSTGKVDFENQTSSVSVNRFGYMISGNLSSATGYIYALTSDTPLELTADSFASQPGVEKYEFRATSIAQQFSNPNANAYYLYYALGNLNGEVTSQIYRVQIQIVEISNAADFHTVATGDTLGDENPATTIYTLTQDISFDKVSYSTTTKSFKGLLNGKGHTVSDVTINGGTSADKIGMFYTVEGGTIMNIKFNNIKISGRQEIGIVANAKGGYFYNIAMTNVLITGSGQRVGGLIGRVTEGDIPTYIDQVSLINPIGTIKDDGTIYDTTSGDNVATEYYIKSSGNRAGGIVGFIQTSNIAHNMIVNVSNCYVETYIAASGYSIGGIVAEYNENGQAGKGYEMSISIINCVSNSVLVGLGSSSRIAGMLGYHASPLVPLTITGCMSLDRIYYSSALVEANQKNISGMVGNYQSSGETITNCISTREEHNTNTTSEVNTYQDRQLRANAAFFGSEGDNAILGLDLETRWTLVYAEGSTTTLAAPYVRLNFLES